MEKIDLNTKLTLKQAYFIMFEYLNSWWTEHDKPDEVGEMLSQLQLWDSEEGKVPMDASIFLEWIECAEKVLSKDDSKGGCKKADIKLIK